jgi:predicted NAD/FAD-binding protein
MRIAIIGAGISGLTAAHYLHADHEITIFEAGSHIGGHANTLVVEEDDRSLPIDTGFIVFNDWTYPHFQEMVLPLGVDIHESDMGFSAKSANSNFEWAGNTLSSLIFNRDNWWRLQPYQILLDMLRFNKQAKRYVASNSHKQWT